MRFDFWNKTKIQNIEPVEEPMQNIDKKSSDPLNDKRINDIKTRVRESLKDWANAVQSAEDFEGQDGLKYHELFNLYRNIELDTHITAVTETIYNRVYQTKFEIYNESGEPQPEKTKLFEKSWFANFVRCFFLAEYYPFQLIQFRNIVNGTFEFCDLVDIYNVRPEQKGFSYDMRVEGADLFYDKEPLKTWTLFLKSSKELGLFNTIAKLFIMSRENWQFWAVYNELFTTPHYIVKTNFQNADHRNNLINWLTKMKHSSFGVVGIDDEISAISNNAGGFASYSNFLDVINKEISKVFLGSTMVLEDGSSRSQSEVHENNTKMFIHSKRIQLQFVINEMVLPKMRALGMNIAETDQFKFNISETISTNEWAEIIAKLAPHFEFDLKQLSEKISLTLDNKEQVASFNNAIKTPENFFNLQEKIKKLYEL